MAGRKVHDCLLMRLDETVCSNNKCVQAAGLLARTRGPRPARFARQEALPLNPESGRPPLSLPTQAEQPDFPYCEATRPGRPPERVLSESRSVSLSIPC